MKIETIEYIANIHGISLKTYLLRKIDRGLTEVDRGLTEIDRSLIKINRNLTEKEV